MAGYGIESVWPIFRTEMLICQSKANSDEKIWLDKITDRKDPKIRKTTIRGLYGNREFHVPF